MLRINPEREHDWLIKGIHWELFKKFKLDHTIKWYMNHLESVLENEMQKTPLGLWDINRSLNLGLTTRTNDRQKQQKRRTCRIMDFAVLAGNIIKLQGSENKDKYVDLAMELKRLWNMKVTVISIVIGALGTVIKRFIRGLEDLEIRGRVKTIQTSAFLRSAKILRRVLETWGDLLSLKL